MWKNYFKMVAKRMAFVFACLAVLVMMVKGYVLAGICIITIFVGAMLSRASAKADEDAEKIFRNRK